MKALFLWKVILNVYKKEKNKIINKMLDKSQLEIYNYI